MPISCVKVNGKERCYIHDAPTNEDCDSLSKYFEKYWSAKVNVLYDVGTDADYEIKINNKTVKLKHDSTLGNYLTSEDGDVSVILRDAIQDLDMRLSD